MSDVIVTVLKTFTRATNGVDKLTYLAGEAYPLPERVALQRQSSGHVKIEELERKAPEPKIETPADKPVETEPSEKPSKSRRKKPKTEET